jgi:acyl-CoA thioester hydrolase
MAVAIPVHVPYFQFDQQGVAFNMWYFGWFDDAMTEFLGQIGYPARAMLADGLDVQLVQPGVQREGTAAEAPGCTRIGALIY